MALTPKRLFLYLCISISLLRLYTLFSRSPLVNKTLFENACELEWVVLYFKESQCKGDVFTIFRVLVIPLSEYSELKKWGFSHLKMKIFSGGGPPDPRVVLDASKINPRKITGMWTQLATPNKMAPVFVDLCAGLVMLLPRQIRRFRHGFFSSAVLDWSLRSCLRVRHLWRQQIADNRRYLRQIFPTWTSSLRSQISLSKRR